MRRLSRLLTLPLVAGLLLVPAHQASARPSDPAPISAPDLAKQRSCANGKPSKIVQDKYNDARSGIEVGAIGIWNKDADACFWTTAAGKFTGKRAQIIQVYYDTKRGKKGWEYQLFAYSPKDGDAKKGAFIAKNNGKGGVLTDCPVYTFWHVGRGEIGIGAPKSCFGSPGHIKVRVIVWDVTKYGKNNRWRGYYDTTPNGKWSPLV